MPSYSIAIITYSGAEHERVNHQIGTPTSAGRVKALLDSLKKNSKFDYFKQIVIFDDNAKDNELGADAVRSTCEYFNIDYNRATWWGGTCAQVNRAIRDLSCDWLIALADDIIILPEWWERTKYFIENNSNIPFYMLTFPVVFAHRLEQWKLLSRKDFYSLPISSINPHKVAAFIEGGSCHVPSYTPHGSGVGVIYRTDKFKELDSTWETTFVPEEIMAWKIWTQSDGVVLQVPTSPLMHYENGSFFGSHQTSPTYWRQAQNLEEELLHRYNLNRGQAQELQLKLMQEKGKLLGDPARVCEYLPFGLQWSYWPQQTFSGFSDLLIGGNVESLIESPIEIKSGAPCD